MKHLIYSSLLFLVFSSGCNKDKGSCADTAVKDSKSKKKEKLCFDFVTDIDGNVYRAVKIGSQWWMIDNLKTTRYNDGTMIHDGATPTWGDIGKYFEHCVESDVYGKFYNWKAVTHDGGKLAPKGWHIPSEAEYNQLIEYLGTYSVGRKMKAISELWKNPHTYANNTSYFSALPAGKVTNCDLVGYGAYFWTTSTYMSQGFSEGYSLEIDDEGRAYTTRNLKGDGLSVRCIKD